MSKIKQTLFYVMIVTLALTLSFAIVLDGRNALETQLKGMESRC